MPNPVAIIARIRQHGANVVVRDGELAVVNARKLPAGAAGFIAENRNALLEHLTGEEVEVDERAAIIEFDGKAPREWAEQFADLLIRRRPPDISDLNWGWFITRCGQIVDEAPERVAA